jgi:transcriptional regulator with XRE-family HTH domain
MKQNDLSLLIEGRSAVRTGSGQKLRERAGLSQSELARLTGVTPGAICRWEAGERTPSEAAAVAYAKALRRVEELIERVTV